MGSTWHDLPVLLRHPLLWRQQLLPSLINRSWRLSSRLAATYRSGVLRDTRIVAIVGSLGKTTTTRAVSAALGYDLPKRYKIGFGNAYNSVGLRILETRPTAPYLVVEAGIREPGQMAPIAQMLRPNITVVTSVGRDHHLRLRTLEVTRSEKAEMVRVLSASGNAILNGDYADVRWMAGQTDARIVTFGFDSGNDVFADGRTLNWPHGMQFRLHAFGQTREVSIRLVGQHMIYPVLAAVAVALVEGLRLDDVIPVLESLPPTPGRLQPVEVGNGAIMLRDDCKATVDSVESAIGFLSEVPAARLGVVFGDMAAPPGDAAQTYEQLGQRIAQIAAFAVFAGDTAAIQGLLRGARRGGLAPRQLVQVPGPATEIARVVREQLEPGDTVLVKGRLSARLGRVVLALEGQSVRCDRPECRWSMLCEHCPLLERSRAERW